MDSSLGLYIGLIIILKLLFWGCIFIYRYKRYQKLSEIRRTLAAIEEQNMRAQAAGSVQVKKLNEEKNIRY